MMRLSVAALAALSLCCAACTEKPQAHGTKKVDSQPWEGAPTAFAAPSYKGGDQAAWEAQMRSRAENQNDYARTAPGQK